MAININDVYQTVLVITNKDNRGYITPEEFNRLADQAQNEIFESYFARESGYELNANIQSDFADPVLNTSEKINVFYANSSLTKAGNIFEFPTNFYRLGVVNVSNTVNSVTTTSVADYVSHEEVRYINLSPLTAPVSTQPVFTLVGETGIRIYPDSITSDVNIDYIKIPEKPKWGYLMPTASQIAAGVPNEPIYDSTAFNPASDDYNATAKSYDFRLHPSEKHALVAKILSYAGVVIKQPDVSGFGQGKDQQLQATEQ